MDINFVNRTKDKTYRAYLDNFKKVFKVTLDYLNLNENYEIAIIMVKDKPMHKINKEFRNIDRTTDVISFANIDFTGTIDEELGDVFINVDAAIRQANEYGHSIEREITFLFLHGLLHCLGYDHLTDVDEAQMIQLQKDIFKKVGSSSE